MKPFRVGIDSYSILPLRLSVFETLDWAKAHNGDGVQFSSVRFEKGQDPNDRGFSREFASRAREMGLYLEWGGGQHIPFDTSTWQPRDIYPVNHSAAKQALALGTRVIRSCSGGLMRWTDEAPPTETLLQCTAQALKKQMPMLENHDVVLAIETHFEFTTWELIRLFEMCAAEPGGCLGICLDTMNLLTLLEDPVAGTERILPWVVATHAKDGGLLLDDQGLVSFTAEVGQGQVDFEGIIERLSTLEGTIHLSIEDHGGSFSIPIFDPVFLSRFPDLTALELSGLMRLAREKIRLKEERSLFPLARSEWPAICESRVARGIKNLKRIVEGLQPKQSSS